MTIASISIPHWVSYSAQTPSGTTIYKNVGLYRECSGGLDSHTCTEFPRTEFCQDDERYFCSVWRRVGFLASVAVILHLAAVVAFLVLMASGRAKRESGWRGLCALLLLVAVLEYSVAGIVVRHD
jgi:hypothetical protein